MIKRMQTAAGAGVSRTNDGDSPRAEAHEVGTGDDEISAVEEAEDPNYGAMLFALVGMFCYSA